MYSHFNTSNTFHLCTGSTVSWSRPKRVHYIFQKSKLVVRKWPCAKCLTLGINKSSFLKLSPSQTLQIHRTLGLAFSITSRNEKNNLLTSDAFIGQRKLAVHDLSFFQNELICHLCICTVNASLACRAVLSRSFHVICFHRGLESAWMITKVIGRLSHTNHSI